MTNKQGHHYHIIEQTDTHIILERDNVREKWSLSYLLERGHVMYIKKHNRYQLINALKSLRSEIKIMIECNRDGQFCKSDIVAGKALKQLDEVERLLK